MTIVAGSLEDMAEKIRRWFLLEAMTPRELARPAHLLEMVAERGWTPVKSLAFPDLPVRADQKIFAVGTDESFWSNDAFLMYSQVCGQPGPYYGRALSIQGRTDVNEFIGYYQSKIWGKIFDVDSVMLGCSTRHLFVVAHYGVLALFQGGAAPPGISPLPHPSA